MAMPHREEDIDEYIQELRAVLLRLMVRFRHDIPELAMKAGLSPPQAMFFLSLHQTGTTSMGDISKLLGTSQGVATRMVDRLIHKGMVERKRDADDRRVVMVSLSQKGRMLAGKMTEVQTEELKQFMAGVVKEDRETLLNLLRRFSERLSAEQ